MLLPFSLAALLRHISGHSEAFEHVSRKSLNRRIAKPFEKQAPEAERLKEEYQRNCTDASRQVAEKIQECKTNAKHNVKNVINARYIHSRNERGSIHPACPAT